VSFTCEGEAMCVSHISMANSNVGLLVDFVSRKAIDCSPMLGLHIAKIRDYC
jgi:hypothetical protein